MPRVKATNYLYHGGANKHSTIESMDWKGIWATASRKEAERYAKMGGEAASFTRGGAQKYKVGYVHELNPHPFFEQMKANFPHTSRTRDGFKNPSSVMKNGGNYDLPSMRPWPGMAGLEHGIVPAGQKVQSGYWVRETKVLKRTVRSQRKPLQAHLRDSGVGVNPRTATVVGVAAVAGAGGYYYYRKRKGRLQRVRNHHAFHSTHAALIHSPRRRKS